MLVQDFIDDFRKSVGDTSRTIPDDFIISYMNTALRRLARTPGLGKLFQRHDTYELSSINEDGTPTASWDLEAGGIIRDIKTFRILMVDDSQVCELKPSYRDAEEFYSYCNVLPEQNACGRPTFYTIEQIGLGNKLIFDRPVDRLLAIDMTYEVFLNKINNAQDTVNFPWVYGDILEEYVRILHKQETTDNSSARAYYEDLDLLTTEAAEDLAKRIGAAPLRYMKRSF